MRAIIGICLVLVIIGVVSAEAAEGQIICVPLSSLQVAIDETKDGDLIIVEKEVSFSDTITESISFRGKAITVRGFDNCSGMNFLIHLAADVPAFIFNSGEGPDSVLEGFHISGRDQESATVGAIEISNASPTIRNCWLTNMSGPQGAAISVKDGGVTIENSQISSNRGIFGAMQVDGKSNAKIINSIFTNNRAAIVAIAGAVISLDGCEISDNDGSYPFTSSAIFLKAATGTVKNSKIFGNSSICCGAIYVSNGSALVMENSVVTANTSDGGNIYLTKDSSATISSCQLVCNGWPSYPHNGSEVILDETCRLEIRDSTIMIATPDWLTYYPSSDEKAGEKPNVTVLGVRLITPESNQELQELNSDFSFKRYGSIP